MPFTDSDPPIVLQSTSLQLVATFERHNAFTFLQDNLLRRQGVQVKTRYPPNLDKTHRKHIMNFLKESGWVATWWRLRFFFSVVSRLRTPC